MVNLIEIWSVDYFCGPPFISHYQLKHKSSNRGQTNHFIESSYTIMYIVDNIAKLSVEMKKSRKEENKECLVKIDTDTS